MKIIILRLSCFLALDSKYDTFKPIPVKSCGGLKLGQIASHDLDHTLGGHYSKSTNIFIVQIFELVASIKYSLCE